MEPPGELEGIGEEEEPDAHLPGFVATSTVRAVRDLARKYTVKAIHEIARLMQKAKNERVRLAAAEAILNRGWGHPGMEVKFTDDTNPEATEKRKKALEELAHDPNYAGKLVVLMQAVGVLPTGAPGEGIEPVTPQDVIEERKIEAQVSYVTEEDEQRVAEEERRAEEGPSCKARPCGHRKSSHPGGAGCIESGCRCPLFIESDEGGTPSPFGLRIPEVVS